MEVLRVNLRIIRFLKTHLELSTIESRYIFSVMSANAYVYIKEMKNTLTTLTSLMQYSVHITS